MESKYKDLLKELFKILTDENETNEMVVVTAIEAIVAFSDENGDDLYE